MNSPTDCLRNLLKLGGDSPLLCCEECGWPANFCARAYERQLVQDDAEYTEEMSLGGVQYEPPHERMSIGRKAT